MTDKHDLETKSAGPETVAAWETFCEGFEDFKETNDLRLAEIERRGSADTVTTEKLARIEEHLDVSKRVTDALILKSSRPPLGGNAYEPANVLAHKSAFDTYVRKGETTRLLSLEQKAL